MQDCTVNVLGTEYRIQKKKYEEEPAFEKRSIDGYCDGYQKLIVYCDMDSISSWNEEPELTKRECEKEVIRHELVHAFLNESGLQSSTYRPERGWAENEEMVDWIANQAPKMFYLFQKLDLL